MQHFDMVMYGDTLVEAWRGTILGEPSLRVQGCSEIFHSHFGHKYSSAIYGIAGRPHRILCQIRLAVTTQRLLAKMSSCSETPDG